MIVHKIAGPPGTGKTTTLTAQARRAAEKYGSDRVMITSFTRAGALEIGSRDTGVKRSNIGTLHSIAWHALGRPKIAEANVESWNEAHPSLRVTPSSRHSAAEGVLEGSGAGAPLGDKLLSSVNILRARLIPEERWPMNERAFYKEWRDWMMEHDYVDFTGIIERAIQVLPYAPGAPKVGIHDEAQDSTALQWRLLRQWARHMDYLVVAGDDDQCLYGWLGATVDEFIAPVSGETRVLGQSYRSPLAVHEYAVQYAEGRIKQRMAKQWAGRDAAGAVARRPLVWKDGRSLAAQLREAAESGSAMLLGSAGYMLRPTITALRESGEMFWNPYRPDRGDWNPIKLDAEGSTPTWQRLLAFMRPHTASELWTVGDVRQWTPLVKKRGVIRQGGVEALDSYGAEVFMTPDLLNVVFDNFEEPMNGGLEWLQEHALAEKRKALEYPSRVLAKQGRDAFFAAPRIMLGTVHSVKGGEADHVFLLPDLSLSAQRAMVADPDAFHRLAYVGMTRARESLTLCAASGQGGFRW